MGSFPYENPFGFGEAWRASYFLIYMIRGWQANTLNIVAFQLQSRQLMKASAYWKRHLLGALCGFPWPMMKGWELD